jgi:phosphoglycolate phosphatase
MSKPLLIFDLDGTLMDTRRDLSTGINLMRRHYGLPPLPVDTIAGYVGDGIRSLVTRSLQGHPADLTEAVRLNYRSYREHIHDETTLYPGVGEGLPQLHAAGYILALISNKPEEACLELLRHFKLAPLFSGVLGGDSVRELKPHPEAILGTIRKLKADPSQTWMIGDHVTDLESARRAGIKSAFTSYGIGKTGAEKPTQTFASFPELTGYFLGTINPAKTG